MESGPIYTMKRKQFPQLVESSIKNAYDIQSEHVMLAVIRSVSSLLASEFKVHKCQKDYTRVCPPKTKRSKIEDECSESTKTEKGEADLDNTETRESTNTVEEMEVDDTLCNQGDCAK